MLRRVQKHILNVRSMRDKVERFAKRLMYFNADRCWQHRVQNIASVGLDGPCRLSRGLCDS